MAIQLCGVLTGLVCAWTVLRTSLAGPAHARAAAVRVLGLQGPWGSFLAAWGGVAMVVSAPFDDFWHRTYGLDEVMLSPPHVVLLGGGMAVQAGLLLLVMAERNRTRVPARRKVLGALVLYLWGMSVASYLILCLDFIPRIFQHSGTFYRAVCLGVPLVLAAAWRTAGDWRFPAARAASVYTALLAGFVWVLPLFPATPRLGPVYVNLTHMVPPEFPLLLIVPAAALDVVLGRVEGRLARPWVGALGGGTFFGVFLAVQWPFASFLMSPAARNAFFGTIYFPFSTHPDSPGFRYVFQAVEHTPERFWLNLALSLALAAGGVWAGLGVGDWMRRVQR